MITLKLYNVSDERKRVAKSLNTALIDTSGILDSGSSVMSPSVTINITATQLTQVNYAYISEYKRYYYITDSTWISGKTWRLHLKEDVLMSHKTGILSSSAYVTRCQSATYSNIVLQDNLYPIEQNANVSVLTATAISGWKSSADAFTTDDTDANPHYIVSAGIGNYIRGMNTDIATINGVTYTALTRDKMTRFLQAGFYTNAPSSYKDRLQEVYWLPVQLDTDSGAYDGIGVQTFANGNDSSLTVDALGDKFKTVKFSVDISGTETSGYEALPPFKHMQVKFLPFGTFELDSSLLYGQSSVSFQVRVNCVSGSADLSYGAGTSPTAWLYLASASVRVSTVIAGSLSAGSWFGMNLVPITTGLIASSKGGLSTAFSGLLNTSHDALMNYSGMYNATGANTNAYIDSAPSVIVHQFYPTPEDGTKFGFPCYRTLSLSDLANTGFVQTGEVDLAISGAYEPELIEIENWLQNGVYL